MEIGARRMATSGPEKRQFYHGLGAVPGHLAAFRASAYNAPSLFAT
jgi:hypothetical protein